MFRATSPQRSMFGVEHRFMDPVKRARLENSWAHAFRGQALPLIDEEPFAKYFDEANGRPNKPVKLVVGVLVLKEVNDLTDAEALEQLEWNATWHVRGGAGDACAVRAMGARCGRWVRGAGDACAVRAMRARRCGRWVRGAGDACEAVRAMGARCGRWVRGAGDAGAR